MKDIEVTSQEQLNAISPDCEDRIIIKFGTAYEPAIINKRYYIMPILRGNSQAVLWGNSQAVLWENSQAELRGNSHAVLRGNSQIVNFQNNEKNITLNGNSRIVYYPKIIEEYINFYSLKTNGQKVILYKAVRKNETENKPVYASNFDHTFKYHIGEIAIADSFTQSDDVECGHGIHCAYLDWCLKFGSDWDDLAILEVEAEINELILPREGDGKVRAPKVKVVREISLEECGLYGKMLAERRKKNDTI